MGDGQSSPTVTFAMMEGCARTRSPTPMGFKRTFDMSTMATWNSCQGIQAISPEAGAASSARTA